MFPRYLFVQLQSGLQDWAPIRSTRGAIGLVRRGEQPAVVPDSVIESLFRRADEHGRIDLAADRELVANDELEVVEGPGAGLRALYVAPRGADRVIVLLSLLQQTRQIELPRAACSRCAGATEPHTFHPVDGAAGNIRLPAGTRRRCARANKQRTVTGELGTDT